MASTIAAPTSGVTTLAGIVVEPFTIPPTLPVTTDRPGPDEVTEASTTTTEADPERAALDSSTSLPRIDEGATAPTTRPAVGSKLPETGPTTVAGTTASLPTVPGPAGEPPVVVVLRQDERTVATAGQPIRVSGIAPGTTVAVRVDAALQAFELVADEFGSVTLPGLASGHYVLVATAEDGRIVTHEVTVMGRMITRLALTGAPTGIARTGLVLLGVGLLVLAAAQPRRRRR